eukprot:1193477-Prorocentrum_minimum.AAC.1
MYTTHDVLASTAGGAAGVSSRCAQQYSALPRADLVHPSRAHRFPPPWPLQYPVLPCADLVQP